MKQNLENKDFESVKERYNKLINDLKVLKKNLV